jgi:hydrogenase nickel incorporation protein HypA/HybF
MHELSICQSIVDSILVELAAIEPKPKRLISARIVAGELRQIIPEFMQEAYSATTKDTEIEGSELQIQVMPIQGKCGACDWKGDLPSGNFECQSCGAERVKFDGGMQLYLDNLEIEK